MAVTDINIGTVANDRTGDKPRTAFSKVNAAFVDLRALITAFGTGANLMLLDAIQTVTGKKTFTQQIESTVVQGTPPLIVASTTAVTNLTSDTTNKVRSRTATDLNAVDTITTSGMWGGSYGGNTANAPSTTAGNLFRRERSATYGVGSAVGTFDLIAENNSSINLIFRKLTAAGVWSSYYNVVHSGNISTIPFINNAAAANSANAGSIRYRVSGNNSYAEMSMQTGASTYAWIPLIQNNW